MKQKFFSLLALALFLALGNNAFAQKGGTGGLGGGTPAPSVGVGSYHFADGGLVEGSFSIDRTQPDAKTKYIGMGNIGCDGYIVLPEGVADLSKASYVIFRCNDGSGETKITLADMAASKPDLQVKVNGSEATLIKD